MCHQGANPGNLPTNATRSKHNGTIYFRNRVGSYETLLIIGASVREDVGQVF